mmetsp:Transcript_5886/g.12319  ORF Transcript_5886/g.12319 Transcript_5886/m.12319 type:complete len:253 (+) Transcript_5886:405-1163(+)|eukprot:CAMPEP_0194346006 /NCGR_PEP_ID=MMETSP0171-20130528/105182_1 /TAXON_ID=218684 /ORGANISM="Corethron pennatum, Strain L29A3" /LENGTH=252 /DNA_ID=CAMNT_0039113073 /DNA_START=1327 /DNA_END=2085 /DNA_ORIENTATION=-
MLERIVEHDCPSLLPLPYFVANPDAARRIASAFLTDAGRGNDQRQMDAEAEVHRPAVRLDARFPAQGAEKCVSERNVPEKVPRRRRRPNVAKQQAGGNRTGRHRAVVSSDLPAPHERVPVPFSVVEGCVSPVPAVHVVLQGAAPFQGQVFLPDVFPEALRLLHHLADDAVPVGDTPPSLRASGRRGGSPERQRPQARQKKRSGVRTVFSCASQYRWAGKKGSAVLGRGIFRGDGGVAADRTISSRRLPQDGD